MTRRKQVLPSCLHHKATGLARVRINGKDHYLGPFGSDESRVRYGTLIAKLAGGAVDPFAERRAPAVDAGEVDHGPTVSELCLAFWRHAEQHYVKNGKPTSEVHCYRSAIKVLRELYGRIPAKDFG